MKQVKLILILLGLAAWGLRWWQFGQVPSILNRDEAALAYNAYSLKEIGLDEWGSRWPIILESFGDDKLIGYPAVLTIVFKLFGESDWAVRLPSMLGGLLLIIASWLWGKRLQLSKWGNALLILLLVTSPVFFFYSRIAYEANLALAYLVMGLWLMTSSSGHLWRRWQSGVGGILILLACLTYNTPLLLLPFLTPLLYLSRKQRRSQFLVSLGIFLVIFVGVVGLLWPVLSQKSGITIFTDLTVRAQWLNWRASMGWVGQSVAGSKLIYLSWLMAQNFLKSFSPYFLVTHGGDHPWHQLVGFGHLLWPTYLLGLYGMTRIAINSVVQRAKLNQLAKVKLGLLITLLLSLAPAVVTVDAPHTTRSLLFIYLWVVMAAIGYDELKNWAKGRWPQVKHVGLVILLAIVFVQTATFTKFVYHYFYTDANAQLNWSVRAGFDQVIREINQSYPNQPVAIVDPGGYQYIVLAWYLRIQPQEFLNSNVRQLPDTIGLRYGERVGRYHFIVNEADRSDTEKVLTMWDENNHSWLIKTY